jgi:serine/threonine-protein kinase
LRIWTEAMAIPLTLADRIDEVCDAFELAWKDDERPQLAAFVEQVDAEARSSLFNELLLVELECRRNRGERPSREEYLATYPAFSAQIEATDFKHGLSTVPVGARHETVSASRLRLGNRISRFELQQRLGAGAMGEVWKAWDPRLQRAVAMKLPRAEQLTEADLHRFLREGQAAAQLQHPQLAAVHDVGRDGDWAYIVTDYVEGDNLRDHLAKQRVSFSFAALLCADVAEALHHAHERGVVHRDLKPANIIVDRDHCPHVIDFGLAKWSSDNRDLTLQGELLGTPAYMAPEQARGDVDGIGPHTDVYALGAILYELVTGRCAFVGSQAAVIQAIISIDPLPPRRADRSIPRDLETICLKALEKDPKKRYRSAQEMAVDLRRVVRGEPILARRVGPVEKGWRWLRRRPAVAASILLVVVAAGAVLAANSFAKKNRALLGFHTVSITTEPRGARLAFARLKNSGELMTTEVTVPSGVTPMRLELLSGDYFVEAVLPDGRFHQVFRRVSKALDTLPLTYAHSRSNVTEDGTIVLPTIKIPAIDITQGMELVSATSQVNVSPSGDRWAEQSFFIDPGSFTVRQARDTYTRMGFDVPITVEGPDNDPMLCSFDEAAALAEMSGKRLPINFEVERLLEARGNANEDIRESPPVTFVDAASAARAKLGQSAATKHARPVYLRFTPSVTFGLGFRCVRSIQPHFIRIDE